MVQQFLKALSTSPELIADGWCIGAPNEDWFTACKGFVRTKEGQGSREPSVFFRSQMMMWFSDRNLLHFTTDINRSQCPCKSLCRNQSNLLSRFLFSGSESGFIESNYLIQHKPCDRPLRGSIKNRAKWGQVFLRLMLFQGSIWDIAWIENDSPP